MKGKRKHTSEELAEALIFPVRLTPAQQKEANEQLAAARKKSRQEMTERDRLTLEMLQLRFQLEDYIDGSAYDPEQGFGHFLKRYIDLLGLKRKDFAEHISIDESLLSQLVNRRRTPPDYLLIRLELHSGNLIPADFWLRLVEKEKQFYIRTDKALRKEERRFVHKLAIAS